MRIYIYVLCFLLLSCNDINFNKSLQKKDNEEILNNKFYYENGDLESIFIRDSTKKIIRSISYYKGNLLKSIIKYKEGKKHDTAIYYYPNGKIECIYSNFNGYRDGSFFYYFRNGGLKLYQFNFSDTLIYEKKYDSISCSMIHEKGFPFKYAFDKEIGLDSFCIMIHSATPPSTSINLLVSNMHSKKVSNIITYSGNEYPIKFYFHLPKGDNLIKIKMILNDSSINKRSVFYANYPYNW